MAIKDGGQAFPTSGITDGMSLLDWFAGQAMNGALAGRPASGVTDASIELIAADSYKMARAMLDERERIAKGGAE